MKTKIFSFVNFRLALITTVNLHFKKAKQLTVSNAFPAQDLNARYLFTFNWFNLN
jgi:hypothetical protein